MAQEKHYSSHEFSDEDLVTASTETIGNNPSQKSLWAHSEMQRRLISALKDSTESTNKYNRIIIGFTVLMAIIALAQLVIASESLPGTWTVRIIGTSLVVAGVVVGTVWLLKRMDF